MKSEEWAVGFWRELKGDLARTTRGANFPGGGGVLEEVTVVDGRGVTLRWMSATRGVVAIQREPYDGPVTPKLSGETTGITTDGDPIATARFIRKRLDALQ